MDYLSPFVVKTVFQETLSHEGVTDDNAKNVDKEPKLRRKLWNDPKKNVPLQYLKYPEKLDYDFFPHFLNLSSFR